MKNIFDLIIDAAKNDDMNRVIELANRQDNFCDNNCVWTDHHPDCVRAEPEWYHTKNIHGCDVFYHKSEERKYMSGKITPLYTHPPVPYVVEPRTTQPKETEQQPVGFVVDLYNGANTPSLPPTATVAWVNDNPKIGQVFYTAPPQRKPLTDAQREEIAKGWRGRNWTVGDIINAVEAAHGVTSKEDL